MILNDRVYKSLDKCNLACFEMTTLEREEIKNDFLNEYDHLSTHELEKLIDEVIEDFENQPNKGAEGLISSYAYKNNIRTSAMETDSSRIIAKKPQNEMISKIRESQKELCEKLFNQSVVYIENINKSNNYFEKIKNFKLGINDLVKSIKLLQIPSELQRPIIHLIGEYEKIANSLKSSEQSDLKIIVILTKNLFNLTINKKSAKDRLVTAEQAWKVGDENKLSKILENANQNHFEKQVERLNFRNCS